MLSTTDQVWLQASNLPDTSVTITLTAPDGTTCLLDQTQVTNFNGVTQVFTVPNKCDSVEGVWSASFNDGANDIASAQFLVVQPPQIQTPP